MSAPRRNVELKAVDPDPARSLAACRELGAVGVSGAKPEEDRACAEAGLAAVLR